MKRLVLFMSILAFLTIVALSCEGAGDVVEDGTKVISDLSEESGESITISGELTDSATGELITGEVRTSIHGSGGELLAEAAGADDGEIIVEGGYLAIELPAATKELLADKSATIVFDVEGYVTSSVLLDTLTDNYSFVVSLVSISNPPSGVSIIEKTIGTLDESGTALVSSTITTEVNETTTETAAITIPAGTIMKDASGMPVTGEVTATVGYFSPLEDEALKSFPGGLSVNIEGQPTENGKPGFFVSGGFVSIDIESANGQQVESFEGQHPSVELSFSDELVSPLTSKKITADDISSLPLWSYNKSTGEWKAESNAKRSMRSRSSSNKKLALNFSIEHLSYYNLDWYSPDRIDQSRPLRYGSTDSTSGGYYTLQLSSDSMGYYREISFNSDEELILYNCPSFELTITVLGRHYFTDDYQGEYFELSRIEGATLAGTDVLTLPLTTELPYITKQ